MQPDCTEIRGLKAERWKTRPGRLADNDSDEVPSQAEFNSVPGHFMFRKATTWEERGQQVQAVKDKCDDIIKNLNLPDNDARVQGMIHVRQFCNTLAAVPIKLQQNAERPQNRCLIMALLGLTNPSDLKTLLNDLNKNSKTAFMTVVQFALENSAARVLEALTNKPRPYKFSDIARRLIENFSLGNDKRELMMLLAYMRNTLHNNGIHSYPDKTIQVAGVDYIFKKGERVHCATWSHILYALKNCLSVYEDIYLHHEITSIDSIETL